MSGKPENRAENTLSWFCSGLNPYKMDRVINRVRNSKPGTLVYIEDMQAFIDRTRELTWWAPDK